MQFVDTTPKSPGYAEPLSEALKPVISVIEAEILARELLIDPIAFEKIRGDWERSVRLLLIEVSSLDLQLHLLRSASHHQSTGG